MSLWIKAAYSAIFTCAAKPCGKINSKTHCSGLPAWVHLQIPQISFVKLVVTWLPASVVLFADSEMSQEDFFKSMYISGF